MLFGSIFAVSTSTLPLVIGFGASALFLVGLVYRPLLLSSINPDLASAQGLGRRVVGLVYMVSLALSVALSALTIGAILSTALLIGPAAAALRLAKSPGRAIACAALIGVAATWAGIVLAYDSYNWPPAQQGWPVSFFVVSLVLAAYLLAQLTGRRGAAGLGAAVLSGLFSGFMVGTWLQASVMAVVAGAVGFFVVLRGSSFEAHAIPQGAFTGAAGAALIGANTLARRR